MIFSENRCPPRIKSGAGFRSKTLYSAGAATATGATGFGGVPTNGFAAPSGRTPTPSPDSIIRHCDANAFTCTRSRSGFIATAAYGTPLDNDLNLFRAFRDRALLRLPGGERLVADLVSWADGAPFDPGPVFDAGLEVPLAAVAYRRALDRGVVRLNVVETRIGRVKVKGNQHFDEANIRRSLPQLQEGKTPNIKQVSAAIKLANENPAKQVQVTLKESDEADKIDVSVQVKDSKPWNAGPNCPQ